MHESKITIIAYDLLNKNWLSIKSRQQQNSQASQFTLLKQVNPYCFKFTVLVLRICFLRKSAFKNPSSLVTISKVWRQQTQFQT